MPKCLKNFSDKNKATKYRNSQRLKNYTTGRQYQRVKTNWTNEELKELLTFNGTDIELSKKLLRSVQAIQVKRSKLKKII